MSSLNKRLLKELTRLTIQQNSKNLLENDYLVSFDESDLSKVFTIIKAPNDSVYRHKFIRLNFDIPDNYPFSPPKVSFVNYDGVRINPCMYENGNCCATILNTWPGKNEAWSSSMGIETVILTFFSFLDNNPYMLEPGERDDSTYTIYVLHQTWYTCLIRYLENRNEQPELFTTFISNYLLMNISDIIQDLRDLNEDYPPDAYETNCFYIGYYMVNYIQIMNKLSEWYNFIDYKENIEYENVDLSFNDFSNTDYSCNICFDTNGVIPPYDVTQIQDDVSMRQSEDEDEHIKLSCKHTFHIECIKLHVKNNGNICSLCRTDISTEDLEKINYAENTLFGGITPNWIINPETKRKVKIGSQTYKRLKLENIIQ